MIHKIGKGGRRQGESNIPSLPRTSDIDEGVRPWGNE
eukprot:CAMPEP_0181411088 /NCGR_PEP_ID=MMETSP1110-20121109/7685_1 /TAXON_ID=174948 /ORGANISM="Symbiodinium sp., Strain CCMP421" /LENGTH=36 /DNA_ID= /DNA_START= /DNA_END= /DNA_ORIENTATION=